MHETGDLLSKLDGLSFIRSLFTGVSTPDASGEVRILCPFHADSSPSCDYNTRKNLYRCLACGSEGSAVDLWAFVKQVPRHKAVEQLAELFGLESSKTINPAIIETWHSVLMQMSELTDTLWRKKGVSPELCVEWRLGWDPEANRVTIPIRDARNRYVNVKKYDLLKMHEGKEKYISIKGHGEARLFPEQALDGDEIHLVEGEIKMIVHRARGFNAMTETGGAHTWKEEWSRRFEGKRVVLLYDVDTTGRAAAKMRAADLARYATEVRDVVVPIDPLEIPKAGVEDWYVRGASAEDVATHIASTPLFVPDEELEDPAFADPNVYDVELGAASKAQYYHRQLRVPTIVSAKDIAPYVLPSEIGVRCRRGAIEACQVCPVASTSSKDTWRVQSDREELLELLEVGRHQQHERIRRMIGIPAGPAGCRSHEIISMTSQNVEEIRLVPQLDATGGAGGTPTGGEQTVVKAFYVGHGLETSAPYHVTGRVCADPEDQHSTLILGDAKPNVDSLTTFKPTKEELDALRIFQPAEWTVEGLDRKLDDLYSDLEGNITRIYHRRSMHLLMDLVWHSVLYLPINGEPKKGWLDALVIGDSGHGKSETFMRLLQHYSLGEWVDMKGASVAGLKGGLQETNKRWWVTWGAIPLNDRRMVILDEVKGCAPEVLQALTSMRSSGLAEVQKIERRRAWARTRLLWISNPRSDRQVETYNYGIQTIKELFGSLEDVRRFDAAMVIASNEVSATDIARQERVSVSPLRHTSELCRRLILWCWSRDHNAVVLEPEAVEIARSEAERQGARYSAGIPLVQPADHRLKLLRLAAALAGRTFSVEEDAGRRDAGRVEQSVSEGDGIRQQREGMGSSLVVRPCHVEYAARFLDSLYESRFMGYDEFSKLKQHEETLANPDDTRRLLLGLPYCRETILGFSRASEIRQTDLVDWTDLDKEEARRIMSALVRENALVRRGNSYFKTGAFIELLRLVLRDLDAGVVMPKEATREY